MSDSANSDRERFEEEYPDEFDGDDNEYEDDEFDCGIMFDARHRLQGCGKAGSEECNFECPYREELGRSLRAQSAQAGRKRKTA
jgi:hypothetical protein